MREKTEVMDENGMRRALARISYEIIERNHGTHDLSIVGMLRRGAELARMIAAKLEQLEGAPVPCGVLDITPFRVDARGGGEDDSRLDQPVSEKTVVLVDDVLHTGRSARAAIDAVFSRGRPRSVQLAVLIDRGHRELPIRPDYVGKNVPTSRDEIVRVMTEGYDGAQRVVILEREA